MLPKPSKSARGISIVRRGTKTDAKGVVELIVGLANFERLEPPDSKAKARLVRDIFDKKRASVFVASIGGKLVGYALYFYTYSSFLAKPTLYLEDIFVREDSRGGGIGEELFLRCVQEAARQGCGRIEWQVLTWNKKATEFYEKLGAKKINDLRLFRLDRNTLLRLSQHCLN